MTRILAYIFGAVVVVGGSIIAFRHPHVPTAATSTASGIEATSTVSSSSMVATSSSSFKGTSSIADLMKKKGNYTCTFSIGGGGAATKGTFYLSNGRMRGDFTSTIARLSMTIQSHMINDGGYAYVWSSMLPEGMKIKVSAEGQSNANPSVKSSVPVDYNQKIDYNCNPWSADASKFALPAGVTFVESAKAVE